MKMPRFLAILTVAFLLVSVSGCKFIDNLKARDQLNKGVKAFKDKAYEDASKRFEEALKYDPEMAVAWEYLAEAYMQQYVPNLFSDRNIAVAKKAITTFEKVLEYQPQNVNCIQKIASLYNSLQEYPKAKEWYRKRVAIEPNNPVPLYGIGVICYQVAHTATPTDDSAKNMAPEEKAKMNAEVDEGIQVLKRAIELDPNYADAMSYLNLCYRKKAILTDDEAVKTDFTRQADQLAAKSLILKKKAQDEEAKKKKMF